MYPPLSKIPLNPTFLKLKLLEIQSLGVLMNGIFKLPAYQSCPDKHQMTSDVYFYLHHIVQRIRLVEKIVIIF
jgi:hypothetical protein